MDGRSPLGDITNVVSPSQIIRRKRAKDGTMKSYVCNRKIRKSIDVSFEVEADKNTFDQNLNFIKEKLQCKTSDELLKKMVDLVLNVLSNSSTSPPQSPTQTASHCDKDKDDVFLCTKGRFMELVDILRDTSSVIGSYAQDFHVAEVCFQDTRSPFMYRWASSPPLKNNYLVNYKMIHAFICSGMLNAQYERLCHHAGIGVTSKYFRQKCLPSYKTTIDNLKNRSVSAALEVERASNNGQLQIATDARHACRKNSIHTDVVALGYNTHRVVHYEHVSKNQEPSSQKHEAAGTRAMYRSFAERHINVSTT